MNDHDEPLDDLGVLIADAVADVEPDDRLAEIRGATARSRRVRRTWYAGGALLAAAATVTAFVVVGPGDEGAEPDPSGPTVAQDDTGTTAVYYVGPGPDGPDAPEGGMLYRYFEPAGPPLELLTQTPSDPDYRSLWPEGAFAGLAEPEGGVVVVTLADDSLHDRPTDLTEREAQLAVEQVVYTVQAFYKEQVAVQFELDGNPIDQVYGVPTSEPLARGSMFEVLSLMNISDPAEGGTYAGAFTARGRANVFEASIACTLRGDGGEFGPYLGTAGWMEERLYPWRARVDLSDVPPGAYTFECTTGDASGGTEGVGAYTDTRSITVE